MKDQHTKISGYRSLTAEEIDAMNGVKELEKFIALVHKELSEISGVNQRDLALARTHFEDGCIRAVRAVARPASPWE